MHPKVSLLSAPDAEPDRYTKRCTAALGFSLVCRIEYPDCVVLGLSDTLLSDLYILRIVVMGSVQRIIQRQYMTNKQNGFMMGMKGVKRKRGWHCYFFLHKNASFLIVMS